MAENQQFDSGNEDWYDCPQGELSRMVRKLDAAKSLARSKRLLQTGLMSMLVVAGVVFAGGVLFTSNSLNYGGITCAECKSHFAAYHGHLSGSAVLEDVSLVKSMGSHLASCKFCENKFNEQYPGVLSTRFDNLTAPLQTSPLPVLAIAKPTAFY